MIQNGNGARLGGSGSRSTCDGGRVIGETNCWAENSAGPVGLSAAEALSEPARVGCEHAPLGRQLVKGRLRLGIEGPMRLSLHLDSTPQIGGGST